MKKLILLPLILVAYWAQGQGWTNTGSYLHPNNLADSVGIGTAQPATKLHVKSSGQNQVIIENSLLYGGNASLQLIGKRNDCNTCNVSYLEFANYDDDIATTYNTARIISGTDGGDLLNGYLRLATYKNGNMVEGMRITSDANIGIGTNSPNARLHVRTKETVTATFENHLNTGADAAIKIQGRRSACTNCDIAGVQFSNFDGDEAGGTEIKLATVSAGMQTSSGQNGYLTFKTSQAGTLNEQMRIGQNGQVLVGTASTESLDFRVIVKDGILTEKVVIQVEGESSWPDYVFAPEYNLRPLSEVASFVKENSHLPEVPSAKQVADEGVNLAEMNATLLQKVEELTLYLIKQNEQLQAQQQEIEALKRQVKAIKK